MVGGSQVTRCMHGYTGSWERRHHDRTSHLIDGFMGHVRLHRTELSAQGFASCAVVAGALLHVLHLSWTSLNCVRKSSSRPHTHTLTGDSWWRQCWRRHANHLTIHLIFQENVIFFSEWKGALRVHLRYRGGGMLGHVLPAEPDEHDGCVSWGHHLGAGLLPPAYGVALRLLYCLLATVSICPHHLATCSSH